MEEAIRFTVLAQSGRYTVTELCEQFGISRKTGYKHMG
jgi:DeoR/GlpR family transcriptional regulator of sugar metabolism